MTSKPANTLTKILISLILISIAVFGQFTPGHAQDASLPLFSDEGRSQISDVTASLPDYIARARKVALNPAAADLFTSARAGTSAITLNLFTDAHFEAQLLASEATTTGGTLLKGFIPGAAYSEVTLVHQDGYLTGGIAFNGQYFRITTEEDGLVTISEINQQGYPEDLQPVTPEIPAAPTSTEPTQREFQDAPNQIDIMVVYTAQARAAAGGTSAMQNLINLAISESNTGYANSQVNHRFILVHTQEFAYTESDYFTMLYDLQDANGDSLDPVHNLRNNYSADLVVMLVENTTYCGLAYLMTNPDTSFAPYAFSLVSINCAAGYYSFGHETGHNMGSQHNRQSARQPGAFDYSYGLYNTTIRFRTIMSYDCPGGCTRINYWSNPAISYQGHPTGISQSDPLAAHNALSLNQTASYVANFRVRPFDPPTDFIYIPTVVK